MLKSYAFSPKQCDASFTYLVNREVEKLKYYFVKFNGIEKYEEAMQKALFHTLYHFDKSKGDLSDYLKKLARVISKNNDKSVPVDFLEDTLSDDNLDNFDDSDNSSTESKLQSGKVNDFASEVCDRLSPDVNIRNDLVELALVFMDKFIVFCDALERHDTTTVYYPDAFIKTGLRLSKVSNNFTSDCIALYNEFKEDFEWFLGLITIEEEKLKASPNEKRWKEADYLLINQCQSKRITLINTSTGALVQNADLEDWTINGNLNKKRIVKVSYTDLWNRLCDLVDSDETNEVKFIIDNRYIIRTLGGSLSIVNPNLYNAYDLIRDEILTNVLSDLNGRVLNVGSENFYLLCDEGFENKIRDRVVLGIPIELSYLDITDSIH